MILVSACLVARPTRYDGRLAPNPELIDFLKDREWLAICPEQLGGLSTPRPPAKIAGGDGTAVLTGRARVVDASRENVTRAFVLGARAVLGIAQRVEAEVCYLKDKSPSCGVMSTSGIQGRIPGPGVCAALLIREGFKVIEVGSRSISTW